MFASLMAAVAIRVAGQFFHASASPRRPATSSKHGLYMALPFVIFAVSYFLGALCWLRVDVTETIPQGTPEADGDQS